MKKYSFSNLSKETYAALLRRPVIDYSMIFSHVQPIIDAVRTNGDTAVKKFTLQFDKVSLDSFTVNVRPADKIVLDITVKSAFEIAYRNINAFHAAQLPQPLMVETMPGVVCQRLPRPIERVGLYITGGSAVLPSSVLMLGIPAQLAGCRQIILATPPNSGGNVPPEVEFAAALCGIEKIFLVGGAQAVAAMAFGTETIPKVDKILGPGNQYVTAAKMMLQNSDAMISIDMPAGPSEVLIVADETAVPSYVAADLLSQAEHGPDSQVVLVTLPGFKRIEFEVALADQLSTLPRSEIAQKALMNSYLLECGHLDEAINFINDYAPEHLILAIADSEAMVSKVMNA